MLCDVWHNNMVDLVISHLVCTKENNDVMTSVTKTGKQTDEENCSRKSHEKEKSMVLIRDIN